MEQWISILMAIDEQYAAPLLVTVGSLLEGLRPGAGLDLYVMSSSLTPETRRKLEDAWDDRVRLHWVPLDDRKLASLRGYGHTSSPAAYFRLLAGSSLPGDVAKVIYLDADLLVRRDIFELWEQDLQDNIVLAVQDSYIQRLPARCLPRERAQTERAQTERAQTERAETGQPETERAQTERAETGQAETERPYFNSGVMVVDLAAWRRSAIEQRCLAAARRLPRRTKWLDQEVLNACLAGRWGSLRPAWNKQFSLDLFPDWRCSPYQEEEFREARSYPAIIHFSSRTKPWHAFCDHRRQDVLAYRAAFRRTAPGAVLEVRPSLARRTVEFFAAPHRRLLDVTGAAVRSKRRKHALRTMLPDILRLAILHPWTLLTAPLSVVHEQAAMWWSGVRRPR